MGETRVVPMVEGGARGGKTESSRERLLFRKKRREAVYCTGAGLMVVELLQCLLEYHGDEEVRRE